MRLSRVSRTLQILAALQSGRKYRSDDLARTLNVSKRTLQRAVIQEAMVKKAVVRYEYFGRAWLMKPDGRLYNIKLRFSPQVAQTVAQVQWHGTQTVIRNSDGSVIIEFRVDGISEITWWILSYGDQVQVLAPRILRERIAKIAMNIVNFNTSA